uniref:Uncharacterized protein n=1 Tax=Anguilla anguilla TaxID=7936 RepID=A0A0E9RB88_ANGAN
MTNNGNENSSCCMPRNENIVLCCGLFEVNATSRFPSTSPCMSLIPVVII